MATITGFTASRMKEIEDATIVDGSVVGDDLILERFDGGTINAGSVRGATGLTGATGDVSTAQLNAAIAGVQSDISASMPLSSIAMYAGSSAPTNWQFCNGQAISRSTYGPLFSIIGTTYGSGDGSTTFNLPDMRHRMPLGLGTEAHANALNKSGGSKNASVIQHDHSISHNHAAGTTSSDTHSHSANHSHTASSAAAGAHSHIIATRDNMNAGGDLGEPMISNSTGTGSLRGTTTQPSHAHGVTVNTATVSTGTDAHDHTFDVDNYSGNSGSTGVSGTDLNLPPFRVVNFIIKVS